jgi:hypothetical protein
MCVQVCKIIISYFQACALVLKADLAYWGIDELFMDPCCALKYYPEIEQCTKVKR